MQNDGLPVVRTRVPGPSSEAWVDRLAQHECPAITARRARRAAALGLADDDPVVWSRAAGALVEDVDGNTFLDFTAGFGVAAVGHAHPAVVAAGQAQLARLPHAMGDAFPDPTRVRLMEALTARTGLPRVVFGSSGSDAVEIALKTARLATGRRRFVAFRRGYHGLSLGALGPLGYKRGDFAGPFAGLVAGDWELHPFGGALPDLTGVAAVLVEPIQGRGGVRVPPVGWLAALGAAARAAGALVIWDEIYTGFGRTGVWFRGEVEGTQPDLLCVGKALGGGFPISACLGSAAAMDAWGASRGEAIHTQTFLGNPVGCAMALATLDVLDGLVPTVAARGERLRRGAEALGLRVRGAGLLLGVEVPDPLRVSRALLGKGVLVLPSGDVGADPDEPVPGGMVLCLTPPFVVSDAQIDHFLHALAAVLA